MTGAPYNPPDVVQAWNDAIAAAEERGRRAGIEQAAQALRAAYWKRATPLLGSNQLAPFYGFAEELEAALKVLAPRDSAPVCDCDSPLFQGSHLPSCPKMQPRGDGKEG